MSIRILVAEDEALIRMDLVEMLQGAGYEVVAQAANGQEAIDLAFVHKPDLAILDVKMPVLDGISAAEKIIDVSPVLMLTAYSQTELIDRARDAGVMAYVVKPFTIGDLIPAIEIAISRHLQMSTLAAEVADAAVFLACPLSDYMTGHTLALDGGLTLVNSSATAIAAAALSALSQPHR